MGGADENKTVLDSGEKYDPDSNTWTPIPPMLQVRWDTCLGLSCCPPQTEADLTRNKIMVLFGVTATRGQERLGFICGHRR